MIAAERSELAEPVLEAVGCVRVAASCECLESVVLGWTAVVAGAILLSGKCFCCLLLACGCGACGSDCEELCLFKAVSSRTVRSVTEC